MFSRKQDSFKAQGEKIVAHPRKKGLHGSQQPHALRFHLSMQIVMVLPTL